MVKFSGNRTQEREWKSRRKSHFVQLLVYQCFPLVLLSPMLTYGTVAAGEIYRNASADKGFLISTLYREVFGIFFDFKPVLPAFELFDLSVSFSLGPYLEALFIMDWSHDALFFLEGAEAADAAVFLLSIIKLLDVSRLENRTRGLSLTPSSHGFSLEAGWALSVRLFRVCRSFS